MNRRQFIVKTGLAVGGVIALSSCASRIRWTRENGLFTGVACDSEPMSPTPGLLTANCRHDGSLRVTVTHRLHNSGAGVGEDVLEVTMMVRNMSDHRQRAEVEFNTTAQPLPQCDGHRAYLPLSACGLFGEWFSVLGVQKFLQNCDQALGVNDIQCHYLEPGASYPDQRETQALLLAPVVDIYHPRSTWRVAIFTPSDMPMRFTSSGAGWRASRQVPVAAGETLTHRCWLMVHQGDATVAWRAFHRFAHREDFAVPDWAREFKVHYYDFLSSAHGEKGRRGDGYESDLPHFREFRVGMATQHGYYPAIGDFIHPDRKTWKAMRGYKQGPADMSFEKMRARIKATRAAGAKAAIYLHPACLDDAAACFAKLKDTSLLNAKRQPINYFWIGPDTAGKNWRMSLASSQWREHLLQQAHWIMDILQPDAIVVDETFAGIAYDHHAERVGATSAAAIGFYRKLRALVRSFGSDKAVFSSDCGVTPFVLWADGDCGDHSYPHQLGNPLYTQKPVRYLAALGDKPWRPCAWHFQQMWSAQMTLARQVGSGVGVSNGWMEYTGLTRLPADVKARMLADITTLFHKGQQP